MRSVEVYIIFKSNGKSILNERVEVFELPVTSNIVSHRLQIQVADLVENSVSAMLQELSMRKDTARWL